MSRFAVLFLAICLAQVLPTQPLSAQTWPWPGTDDPGFVTARALWLSGTDDLAAIGQLADLARAGNQPAQLLLGVLVAGGQLPEAVEDLPRADRIALTRAEGGLSGTSWLRVAGQADPLAAAIETVAIGLATTTPTERRAALETLLAAGETCHAMSVLAFSYNYGGFGPEGGWTLTAQFGAHPALHGHGLAMLQGMQQLLVTPSNGVDDPATLVVVREALAAIKEEATGVAEPLMAFCRVGCPTEADSCTDALVQTVGGNVGYVTLSPVETLIDSATYQSSPRFSDDLRWQYSMSVARVAERNACAASLLE